MIDPPRPSFNEAAASHRGKRPSPLRSRSATGSFNEAAASHRGKLLHRHVLRRADVASMRPRHHTAENEEQMKRTVCLNGASMRPRHHTAENITMASDVSTKLPLQ